MLLTAATLLASASSFKPTTDANMNGEYHVSNLPKGSNFSTNFKDYPG